MSLPRTSRELLHAIVSMTDNNGELDPGREDEGIALIEGCIRAQEANAIEEAARTFESEYCDHDSPMIGTIRGLKAIRALAKARMQPAGEANDRS